MKRTVILIDIISSLLVLLFVYTAISKLYAHDMFRYILSKSPLIKHFALILSWLLPVIELVIGLLLVINTTKIFGLYFSLATLSIFTLYLAYSIVLSKEDLPCSCCGVISKLTWTQHILFNLFFILLSITGIILHRKNNKFVAHSPP